MDNGYTDTFELKYTWEIRLFTEDKEPVDITPLYINSVEKNVDYKKHFTAYLKVEIGLNNTHMAIVKENKIKLLAEVKMYKHLAMVQPDSKEPSTSIVSTTLDLHNIFSVILEEEDFADDKKDLTEEELNNRDELDTPVNDIDSNNVTIYLNSLTYQHMRKKTYNHVLKGSGTDKPSTIDVTSALRYIAETSGCTGYIMDEPDNIVPYEYIILPSGGLRMTIEALQTLYGVYTRGILPFIDLDGTLYLLSKYSDTHDVAENGYNNVMIIVDNRQGDDFGPMNAHRTTYNDKDKSITYSIFQTMAETEANIAMGEVLGDGVIYSNYQMGKEALTYVKGELKETANPTREYLRGIKSHEKTGVKLSFDYDELNNPFHLYSEIAKNSVHSLVHFGGIKMDTECFKPNTIYTIKVISESSDKSIRYENRFFIIDSYSNRWELKKGTDGRYHELLSNVTLVDVNKNFDNK